MNVDFSQFRNTDIPDFLNKAANFSSELGLAKIEVPLFFVVLQQECPDELKLFFDEAGIDANSLYTNVGGIISNLERSETEHSGHLPIAESLIEVLNLTLQIDNKIPQMSYEHGGLILALFLVQGSLCTLGQTMGLTSATMQRIVTRPLITSGHTSDGNISDNRPSATGVYPDDPDSAYQPSHLQRTQASTEASNCPTVMQFCVNWIEKAREGTIEPVIGRDKEIKRVLQILSRRSKNNPVLVGEPGTGKTAVVEGLAHSLLCGDVPEDLANLKLYQLDFSIIESINNGEEIMRKLVDELKQDPQIVLFIDEIHILISTCNCSNNSIANMLKPEMARGTIKILGATTLDEYTKHIEKDKAFERRFQKVIVDEPSIDDAIAILQGIKNRFENHHCVNIPNDVVECAVKLSHRYITDRRLPDKAIDLLDEAASCIRMERSSDTLSLKDVMKVVTNWTGIPMQSMSEDDTERLRHIEECLHNSVIGQDKAITAVANAIRRSRMGLNDASRPIGSFLFLGTTGVGKTELCKALAEFLFRSRDMIVRIDMSEYQQEHSTARLFGAPPGYIGYEQGGQLTEAVRRKPYSLVLFDEIEKANPKIFETLLQVLDDGRMTDGQGRVVDFKNTIVVMTSNMGQDVIMRNLTGKIPDEMQIEQTSEAVLSQLRLRVAPEFINRIDNIVMFMPLTCSDVCQIADLQLKSAIKRMVSNNIHVTYTSRVLDFVAEKGYQPEYGGRPVKRIINTHIIDAISSAIINGNIARNRPIECDIQNESVIFRNV